MDLILWRHADAEAGFPDLARPLTEKGIAQARRVGAWLDRHLPAGTRVLASPAERAQQTAKALTRRIHTIPEIGPGATAEAVIAATGWPGAHESVLVVGHQPTLGEVAALLVSGDARYWTIRKGAVWWLSNRVREGVATTIVKAVIGPDLV